jgi:environmental stress-induced protein Ves
MRKLAPPSYRTMPWKNGGGTTIEIARSPEPPEGAGLDDLDWRVSMARVDGPGPFSRFEGVDRTLAVLDGGR